MNEQNEGADWDPREAQVLKNQIGAYDQMRGRCPVARSQFLQWSVFRHRDVLHILEDHETFSNVVSRHLSVPNGMDPPEHGHYRAIVEPYFSTRKMAAFEPQCRMLVRDLIQALPRNRSVEVMSTLARPYAMQVQCAFMGWPQSVQAPLADWVEKNQAATLAQDRDALASLAAEFEQHMRTVLEACRQQGAGESVTGSLMREQVAGEPLSETALISLLRNWTVGELGTIAASVGIVLGYLARHPLLWQSLRSHPESLDEVIDEILRLDAPLIANRRVTTREVEIGGRRIPAGEQLTLLWASANRDEAVFGDGDALRPRENARYNLLYGAGIHQCPGAPLARLELRVLMEALLETFSGIRVVPGDPEVRARYPMGGFQHLPLVFADRD